MRYLNIIAVFITLAFIVACNEHSLPATWEEGKDHIVSEMDDASGNTYLTVQVNDQEWMNQNMRDLKGQDEEGCENPLSNKECQIEGAYYSYQQAQELCPDPWRLPTQAEFQELINYAGQMISKNCLDNDDCSWYAGEALKGEEGWGRFAGDDLLKVNMTPQGYQDISDEYLQVNEYGYYWTADTVKNPQFGDQRASAVSLYVTKKEGLFFNENFRDVKMSVRCIKDVNEYE